ncbi:MAG: prepilin peptidase [Oscillospiraceae bacterium]
MNMVASAIFGLAGAFSGFFIPDIAQKIAVYKCGKKNMALPADRRYTSVLLKMAFCVFNAAAWALSGLFMEKPAVSFFMSALITVAALVAVTDMRIRLVPNELVFVILTLGAVFQILHLGFGSLLNSAVCMIAMIVFFTAAAGFVGFGKVGAGDVKLAGAMGFVLGYPNIIIALAILCAVLFLYTLSGLILKKLTLKSMFPFAPFMMTGMVAALVFIVFESMFFPGSTF